MRIPQDAISREILRVKDVPNNASIQLIYDDVMYGNKMRCKVILEGILADKDYGEMIHRLIHDFEGTTFAYYLDVPFTETLKRTKPNLTLKSTVKQR